MVNKIKTAFIGTGCMSYLKTLRQFSVIEVAGVWDGESQSIAFEAQNENVHNYQSFEEILNDPEVKLVVNAETPARTFECSERLLNSGKNVYVGKLIACSYEDGKKLVDLAKEKKLMFACGPDCFMNGGMQTARWMIDEGYAGNVRSFGRGNYGTIHTM